MSLVDVDNTCTTIWNLSCNLLSPENDNWNEYYVTVITDISVHIGLGYHSVNSSHRKVSG